MLGLVKRDENGEIRYGHLFLNDQSVCENWLRRLKLAGFSYFLKYSDVQGRHSLMFCR